MLEFIRIDQPRPFDLVNNPVLVSGTATGFEATLTYRISDGTTQLSGSFNVGGGTGELAQFQLAVDCSQAEFVVDRIFVEVRDDGGADDDDPVWKPRVVVPVFYGPRLAANYQGYRLHQVQEGETLWSIAGIHHGDNERWRQIFRANTDRIWDPGMIFQGQVLRVPIGSDDN